MIHAILAYTCRWLDLESAIYSTQYKLLSLTVLRLLVINTSSVHDCAWNQLEVYVNTTNVKSLCDNSFSLDSVSISIYTGLDSSVAT